MTFAAYITWRFDWEPNQTRQIVANTRYSCILWRSITRLAVSHSSQINFSMYTHETVCVCVCVCASVFFSILMWTRVFRAWKHREYILVENWQSFNSVLRCGLVDSLHNRSNLQWFYLFIHLPTDIIGGFDIELNSIPISISNYWQYIHTNTRTTPPLIQLHFFFIIHLIWWNFTFIIRNGLLLTISQLK